MTATATRDLLAATSLLFDKSDAVFEETQRLARSLQARRAVAEASELRRLVASGLDASSPLIASDKAAPLAGALADCRAAAAAIASLHENRDAVVEARREAMETAAAASSARRAKVAEELMASAA